MRYIAILPLLLLPFLSFGQKQADYEHMVGSFMKFYNAGQPDSICNLLSDEWGEHKKTLWTDQKIKRLKNDYGNMISYKYLELYKDGTGTGDGGGDGLAFFKVQFTKSTHIMGITLSKQNELLTFRFHTTSPHIDSLFKKNS